MKKTLLRIITFVLLFATILATLPSCTPASEQAVITYGDYSISRGVFQYLCCLEKTNYLYEAYGVSTDDVSSSELQDYPEIWSAQDESGVSVADTLKMQVLETCQNYLFFCQQAKDMGYELNQEQKNVVINEFAKMVIQNFSTKKEFNAVMKNYGIDYDKMLDYNMIQALAYQGEDLLFGDNGTMAISEKSAKKYFEGNYITVDCIFINTTNKTYPNGKVVVLPENEKEEKKALADDVFQRAQNGEDFKALVEKYADQTLTDEQKEKGYTFEKGGFINTEAEEKAFSMAEGEIARVDTENGVYILCKNKLNKDYFENETDMIVFLLESAKKASLIADNQKEFKLDEEYLNSIDVSALKHVV